MKIIRIVFLVSLSIQLLAGRFQIEKKIGIFDFDKRRLSYNEIISRYGKGYNDDFQQPVLKITYYIPDQKLWIRFIFSHVRDQNGNSYMESIFLTKQKLCDEKYKAKKSFGCLITANGIKIGDSISKIINVYGNPSVIIDYSLEDKYSYLKEELGFKNGMVIRYLGNSDVLMFSEYYFINNLLCSILISSSE